jgi:hypothetical protein
MIAVVGFGRISFFTCDISKEDIKQLAERMKTNERFYEVSYEGGEVSFQMSGNKGIDYTELTKIKDELVQKNAKMEIRVTEFVEGDDGFYYSSEDENAAT